MPPLEVARVLAMTDIADSTLTTVRLGDRHSAALWAAHDRIARDLLHAWRGREIDKSDGFLLLFETVADALGYAGAYHAALAASQPPLGARAVVHVGPLRLRENPPRDVARGAKPIEVDGIAKSTAARILALARPGQTLLSAAACAELSIAPGMEVRSHGHWRFKGIDDAIELFEAGDEASLFAPPADGAKGWRVVRRNDVWVPARELPHTLPAERDRFIDRVATLGELAGRLAGGTRLLSLLGTGGAGKTRLAVRFGWTWLGDFNGGVWFCDVSAARDFDGIVHATAHGLGLALTDADPARQIGDAIAGRGECLVIVDNFEQVAVHAESAIGRWLERAPAATFVVTTRERLGIVGEDAVQLPPLPSDDAGAMLRERAAAAGAGTFTAQDEAALPELVALLDGLPLAIELAASRMGMLPPSQLLPRMGERFSVLTSSRGRRDRQATLRATLDWSWGLLGEPERETLARLSVFENGFGVDAAHAVVASSAYGASRLVQTLQSLLDKSLLRGVGPGRFDLLRSVQDYVAERLPEAARAAAASAHADHFLNWLGGLRSAIERSDRATLQRLDADFANCRAAWLWAAGHGDVRALMRCTPSLLHFCDHRGRFEECRALLRTAIDSCAGDAHPRFEPLLSSAIAHLEYRLDRYRDAEATALRALAASRRTRDAETRLQCFKVLGACCIALGGHASAERHLRRALRRSLAQGDIRGAADMLDNLALIEKALGRYDASLRLSMQSLEHYRRLGHVAGEALCLNNVGAMQLDRGQYEPASSHLRAALELSERDELVGTRALVLANLTELALKTGDADSARERAGGALALARHIGARTVESWLELQLARIALLHHDSDAARLHLRTAMAVAIDIGRPFLQLSAVAVFAEVLAADGSIDDARRVLAFAAGHPAMPRNARDELLALYARWGTHAPAAAPAFDLEALARRIVDETDIAHAPLIGMLREAR